MKLSKVFVAIAILVSLAGCATPKAVPSTPKEPSIEQVAKEIKDLGNTFQTCYDSQTHDGKDVDSKNSKVQAKAWGVMRDCYAEYANGLSNLKVQAKDEDLKTRLVEATMKVSVAANTVANNTKNVSNYNDAFDKFIDNATDQKGIQATLFSAYGIPLN